MKERKILSKQKHASLCIVLLCAMTLISQSCSHNTETESKADWPSYANTLIGTDWVGNTYPGASAPFGLVQLSPDNGRSGWNYIAGYYYPDTLIAGFSHTHLSGTGAGDLYDVSFMPYPIWQGAEKQTWGERIAFEHSQESTQAGYYAVELKNGIGVELTATKHCGIQRYSNPSPALELQLDLARSLNWDRTEQSYFRQVNDSCIEGYRYSDGWARNQKVFFRTRFSKPIKSLEIDTIALSKEDETKQGYRVRLCFDTPTAADGKSTTLLLLTGISGTDLDGAKRNLELECPHFDFDSYRKATQDEWQMQLGKIETRKAIRSRIDTIFRTALYHSLLCPNLMSDADGRYRRPNESIALAESPHYSCFSLWDTYRALHPLLQIIEPERSREMAASLLRFARDSEGMLPVWSLWGKETNMMIGQHAIPVLADSYLKGNLLDTLRPYTSECFQINQHSRNNTSIGFLAADSVGESVSKTIEYAYDDYAIMQWLLWQREIKLDEESYQYWQEAATAHRKLYDAETGFFRARNSKGEWLPDFDPFEYSKHFIESNAWQYLFAVQHDMEWLMEAMGGREAFAKRLDQFFSLETPKHIELPIFSTGMIGQYAHGNEPSHHVIYLYNLARQPWKAAELLRKVMLDLYKNSPDGLCGNEDCGQLSAWYLFSAMGFYPVDPLSNRYEIGTPLFEETSIRISPSKVFRIRAKGLSHENKYIAAVMLNGKPYRQSYITWQMIADGSQIDLIMSDKPGQIWY